MKIKVIIFLQAGVEGITTKIQRAMKTPAHNLKR